MEELPFIPADEFRQRAVRLQEKMEEESIDLLVVNSNDRMTAGQANVRYLSDFAAHFEPACCLLPRRGEPVLVTGPESEALAQLTSAVRRIVIVREYAHPEEDYPWARMQDLQDVLRELEQGQGAPIRRVGIVGQELMEQRIAQVLSGSYGLCPADHLMTQLRSIKSASELAVIRQVYRIAEAGVRAALSAIREGVREYEVAAEAEYAMRKMGSEGTGIDTMVACGADNCRPIIARTTSRRISPREIIWLTVVPKFRGYHAAIGRPLSIGAPDAAIVEAARTAQEAQERIVSNLKPGRRGRDVEREGRVAMAARGLDRYFAYIGLHSVGLIEFEPPIFFSGSDDTIRADMVLSVDVPCFLAPWGGLRIEDGYRVTESGCVALDSIEPGLLILD